jgi:hypothetical protein
MDDNVAEKSRNRWFGIVCAILGLLVGAPASYLFQDESEKHGISAYLANLGTVVLKRDTASLTALATLAGFALAGFLIGLFVAGIVSGLKESKAGPSGTQSRK